MTNWQAKFKGLHDRYGNNFDVFTRDSKDLVQIGNALIGIDEIGNPFKRPTVTGYNIILPEHISTLGDIYHPVLTYANFISVYDHFDELLTGMEDIGLIKSENQVIAIPRASRYFWKEKIEYKDTIKEVLKVEATVDAIAIFLLDDPATDALKISNHLVQYADAHSSDAIRESFEVPDIRVTYTSHIAQVLLAPTLGAEESEQSNFQTIMLNSLRRLVELQTQDH